MNESPSTSSVTAYYRHAPLHLPSARPQPPTTTLVLNSPQKPNEFLIRILAQCLWEHGRPAVEALFELALSLFALAETLIFSFPFLALVLARMPFRLAERALVA